MHVLVAVDVVGRVPPGVLEGVELGADLVRHGLRRQAVGEGGGEQAAERWQALAPGPARRGAERGLVGQGQVQADVGRRACRHRAQVARGRPRT